MEQPGGSVVPARSGSPGKDPGGGPTRYRQHSQQSGGMQPESGKIHRSEGFARRAITILERVLGKDLAVAGAQDNLAAICYDEAKYLEAEPLYRHTLANSRDSCGRITARCREPEQPAELRYGLVSRLTQ